MWGYCEIRKAFAHHLSFKKLLWGHKSTSVHQRVSCEDTLFALNNITSSTRFFFFFLLVLALDNTILWTLVIVHHKMFHWNFQWKEHSFSFLYKTTLLLMKYMILPCKLLHKTIYSQQYGKRSILISLWVNKYRFDFRTS